MSDDINSDLAAVARALCRDAHAPADICDCPGPNPCLAIDPEYGFLRRARVILSADPVRAVLIAELTRLRDVVGEMDINLMDVVLDRAAAQVAE